MKVLRSMTVAVAALLTAALAQAAGGPEVRLYTLDCGHAELRDMAPASDAGETDGHPGELADPCFLVRHPKGWLLWDAGMPQPLPPSLVHDTPPAQTMRVLGFRVWMQHSVGEQLAAIGVRPEEVSLIAFSHLHWDHVGQAAMFSHATAILQRDELAWAQQTPPRVSIAPELLAPILRAPRRLIDGDADVFGDGSVRILKTPGHTPGSSVLLLQLPHTGAVVLSGDLYLSETGRAEHEVPAVNADRADTLASMQRVEALVRRLNARVIVQHDPQAIARLPVAPAFLD